MSGATDRSWRAIAPGRVNLIGEHTDYNGLPVLPIAIDRDIRIDFRVAGESMVRLDNASTRFAPFDFRLDRPIEAAPQGTGRTTCGPPLAACWTMASPCLAA